jgi:hypothetical protein
MERVAVMTQPLDALYHVRFGRGLTPAVDAILRIAPDLRSTHAGYEGARGQVDGPHIHGKQTIEEFGFETFERLGRMADPGVIDEDVGYTDERCDVFRHSLDRGESPDVHDDRRSLWAQARRQYRSRVAIHIGNNDTCTFADKAFCNASADTGCRSGNHSRSILQTHWDNSTDSAVPCSHGFKFGKSVKRFKALFTTMSGVTRATER